MFLRVISFLVGLIALSAGLRNYDSALATAPIPVVTGALVMLIAVFNLFPEIKRCSSCKRKMPKKRVVCPFCGSKQPSLDS
jgi:rRNA maturation endonuclease Nob1